MRPRFEILQPAAIWRAKLGLGFLAAALLINYLHYLLFDNEDFIFRFIMAQLGFLPISVFLVTIVINSLLARREKQSLLNKLNMVIGTFFSETGNELLEHLSELDENLDRIDSKLRVNSEWTAKDFQRAREQVEAHQFEIRIRVNRMEKLKPFLLEKRHFLLGLLRNPTLLEHDSFTDLLWAVFHLAEELYFRRRFSRENPKDLEHLGGDVVRAYRLLLLEWLSYMEHLQRAYPYLFSLATRTNTFAPERRVEID